MIASLAFLPLEDVFIGFDELSEVLPNECDTLYRYFKETYVGSSANPNPRRGGIVATFPPALWNQHERTVNGKPRTNNMYMISLSYLLLQHS